MDFHMTFFRGLPLRELSLTTSSSPLSIEREHVQEMSVLQVSKVTQAKLHL